tara:strand:+ start:375 stop:689 length:315 start_codon:yes stop_codon:yes gene_type:complete
MKYKQIPIGNGVVRGEYDYSEELSKPCNDNEHDVFWNGIQIRIHIKNDYIQGIVDHYEIYCSKPNHVTSTSYRSYFSSIRYTVEEIKANILAEFGEEPLQASLF